MRRQREEKREKKLICSAIANQESLSILEVEMRKLEAVTKEIVDELGYLQRREMRMRDTNGESLYLVFFASCIFQMPISSDGTFLRELS
jgi:uncharacterized protein YsxB (DUF464 family)